MQGRMKLDWVNVVVDNMLKTNRIGFFKCPYAVLISRILDHFKMDTQDKIFYFVELKFEVNSKVLKQMGYLYIEVDEKGGGWIQKPKEGEGTTIVIVKEKLMSPFELMMVAKMEEFMRMHKEGYRELNECFETISESLDGLGALMWKICDSSLSYPS